MYKRSVRKYNIGGAEVEKHKFHQRKNLILLEDVDIKKYRRLIQFLQVKK